MAQALGQSEVDIQGDPAALAALSGGSVGGALSLSLMGGLAMYGELVALLDTMPRLDRARALKLAEAAAAQDEAQEKDADGVATLITAARTALAQDEEDDDSSDPAVPSEAEQGGTA